MLIACLSLDRFFFPSSFTETFSSMCGNLQHNHTVLIKSFAVGEYLLSLADGWYSKTLLFCTIDVADKGESIH